MYPPWGWEGFRRVGGGGGIEGLGVDWELKLMGRIFVFWFEISEIFTLLYLTSCISLEVFKSLFIYWLSGRAEWKNIWLEIIVYRPSTAKSVCQDQEQNISHPVQPNLVNKYFIIWPIWRQIFLKF